MTFKLPKFKLPIPKLNLKAIPVWQLLLLIGGIAVVIALFMNTTGFKLGEWSWGNWTSPMWSTQNGSWETPKWGYANWMNQQTTTTTQTINLGTYLCTYMKLNNLTNSTLDRTTCYLDGLGHDCKCLSTFS